MIEKIVLISVVLILSVNSDERGNCVNFGEPCGLHRHCCAGDLRCQWSDSTVQYECKPKVKLGESCQRTIDCIDILHSVCTEKKCQCREKNIKINDHACAPLLKAFCWRNETCALKNSVCINSECQCSPGFVLDNGKCLPAVIGQPCNHDADCEDVKFAACNSENGVCKCSGNTIETGERKCSVALGGICKYNQDCGIAESECIDNTCQCHDQFFAFSNVECKLPYHGMPCKTSAVCTAHIKNSQCTHNLCTCSRGYSLWPENLCLPKSEWLCQSPSDCNDNNTLCIASRCQCKPDYIFRGSKCIPKTLKGRCRDDAECSEIKNSNCYKQRCNCNDGYYAANTTTCLKALGGSCSVDQDCSIKASYCCYKVCQCDQGYIEWSPSECIPTVLGSFCRNDSSCDLIKNARCVESQCSCQENHIEVNDTACAPLLGAKCSAESKCNPKHSNCIDGKCQCEFSYYQQSNHECVLRYLEKWCRIDQNCIDIPFAKCSDAEKCVCQPNYTRIGPESCAPTLGGFCHQDKNCITDDAVCYQNQCICGSGFMQESDDLCLPVYLGQDCDTDTDCEKILNAECFDFKCRCRLGYSKFDRHVCLPLIGTNCTEHKECHVYNSNCIDNSCQCLETFFPLTDSQCVPGQLTLECYSNTDCDGILNSKCSRFGYCVCKQNYISMEGKECVPALGVRCTRRGACFTANSDCIDEKCQCKVGFVSGDFNECLPAHIQQFCETDSDCKMIKNARCIKNKCQCRVNFIVSDSSTCLPLLRGHCTSNQECTVENSLCIDNKCQCSSNYLFQDLYTCIQKTLGSQCRDNSDCIVITKSICSNGVCVCQPGSFAMNPSKCSAFLNSFCSSSDDCGVPRSHCIDGKCQCRPDWAAITDATCVPESSLYHCDDVLECGEPWRAKCEQHQCTCKSNHIAVGTLMCLPILGGSCWKKDQCTTKNSDCIDFGCQCSTGFVAVANNLCVKH